MPPYWQTSMSGRRLEDESGTIWCLEAHVGGPRKSGRRPTFQPEFQVRPVYVSPLFILQRKQKKTRKSEIFTNLRGNLVKGKVGFILAFRFLGL